jgi:glycolate oxidase iron-sulfur subunit
VTAAPTTAPNWFDADDAPARVDLETCIHCGLCLTACPTYRELKIEPDSPRGRLYLMRGLSEGRIEPSDELVHHLDLCLDCRACETVCPAGVPYGRLIEATRGQLSRRATRRGPLRAFGEWVLRNVMPDRHRMHLMADFLRLSQTGPIHALVRSRLARRLMPEWARQGLELTPPLAARSERGLERLADHLPQGARMEAFATELRFHPGGVPRAQVALFTTCVMDVMFPEVNREAVRLLVLAGCEVRVPRNQTCCGALHAHAGLRHEAKQLARANARAFVEADFVVTTSAGCGAALREAGHLLHAEEGAEAAARLSQRTRDVSQVLHELGLPRPERSLADARGPLRVAYHDPCHLAHAQGVRAEPRSLLRALPGVELVDLPNPDWCCGSAGVYNLTHPDMADAQLARKLDSIERVAPELVVASNPGCLLHMSRGAKQRGSAARIVHLVEVLGRAYPVPPAA